MSLELSSHSPASDEHEPNTFSAAALTWSSQACIHLPHLPPDALLSIIAASLPHLTPANLLHLASHLPPRLNLKRDFLAELPPELALHILGFVDDVKTLARAGRVSKVWWGLVRDEAVWKVMCARRGFELREGERRAKMSVREKRPRSLASVMRLWATSTDDELQQVSGDPSFNDEYYTNIPSFYPPPTPPPPFSYRKHFKTAHLTESNWRHSGRLVRSHRSQDAGVVTSLALDAHWIVVGLANARVHVFSASTGVLARTLIGHEAGVWSLWLVSRGGGPSTESNADVEEENVPRDDSWASMLRTGIGMGVGAGTVAATAASLSAASTSSSSSSTSTDMPFQSVFDALHPSPSSRTNTDPQDGGQSDPCNASRGWGQTSALVVSGGCDKQIRVWDIKSGFCLYVLRGHRSTVRCIKVLHGRPVAVSGGRDHTLRVWDIQAGKLLRTLEGHTDSVRCLDVYGNQVVSGSYDCTVRLWDVDTGACLRVFNGHYHQVYTVAFDGVRIVSGGLDTSVRVWSARSGACLALLQGHTTLVCQLQLSSRTNTVITGSADGRIIIFSIAPVTSSSPSSTPMLVPPAHAHVPHPSDTPASPPTSPFLPSLGLTPAPTPTHDAGYSILARVPAHTSSVTGLQFDEDGRKWIVSGGNDGRVLLWEVEERAGGGEVGGMQMRLVRDLTEQCEGLWKVAFRGDVAVICCLRAGRTVLEIWSFRPVEEEL
ncbi:WD40 repeat-like protein [Ramaria rubella]|nr:WD40 repeat-like protein [Ramaria rubella]